jgi:hypothetical protein
MRSKSTFNRRLERLEEFLPPPAIQLEELDELAALGDLERLVDALEDAPADVALEWFGRDVPEDCQAALARCRADIEILRAAGGVPSLLEAEREGTPFGRHFHELMELKRDSPDAEDEEDEEE